MLCVEGEYIVTIDGVEHTLCAGDELFIPKGSVQGGRVKKELGPFMLLVVRE
jgi:Cupin domain.